MYSQNVSKKKYNWRVHNLNESTHLGLPWCKEFLRDMEQFNDYLSRRFRLSVRAVDQKVALSVERQRLREANEGLPTREEVRVQVEPKRTPRRPPREMTESDMDKFLEELDF